MTNIRIFGGSRGLGAELSWGVPVRGDAVWLVSRGRSDLDDCDGVQRVWIEADLSAPGAGPTVARAVGDKSLDVVICNAGIWEHNAFRDSYDFMRVDDAETERILGLSWGLHFPILKFAARSGLPYSGIAAATICGVALALLAIRNRSLMTRLLSLSRL